MALLVFGRSSRDSFDNLSFRFEFLQSNVPINSVLIAGDKSNLLPSVHSRRTELVLPGGRRPHRDVGRARRERRITPPERHKTIHPWERQALKEAAGLGTSRHQQPPEPVRVLGNGRTTHERFAFNSSNDRGLPSLTIG